MPKIPIIPLVVALALGGCTVTQLQRGAVAAEHTLTALSEDWGERLDAQIAECDRHFPDAGPMRDGCIEPAVAIDDAVALTEAAAVAALRAFWLGVGIGEDPADLARHLNELRRAVASFPLDEIRKLGGTP